MKKIILAVLLLQLPFLNFNASAYDKLEFKGQIKHSGLVKPINVSVCEGKVFVIDSKAKALFIFDDKGKFLKKTNTNLKSPSAAACGDNRVYVADSKKSEINVFDFAGKFLWAFASKGSMPGRLNAPMGITIDSAGRVYVSNTGNKRVDIYNSDGIFIYGFPTLMADKISAISPSKISIDRSLNMYVSDKKGKVLVKYGVNGEVLKQFDFRNNVLKAENQ